MNATRSPKPVVANPDKSSRWFVIAIGALIVAGLLAVAVLASNRTPDYAAEQVAAVELSGDPLPPLPAGTNRTDVSSDQMAGQVAPTLTGTDFTGNTVSIEPDGRAKAIYFVAHWCPHCQEEIPVLQQLIDDGRVPGDVDVYAVSTGVEQTSGNYPPEVWLADEGFSAPVVRDSELSDGFGHFGGSGFPYAVYLDAEHRVVGRTAGQVGAETIESLWVASAGG